MAFTRKFLSALGIEADKVDEIISAHTEVTDSLKEERDKFKADAEKLPTVEAERDELKAKLEGGDPYKEKYEALQAEYDKFKADVDAKATTAMKEKALRGMLRDIGISEKRMDTIVKVTDIDAIELDETGAMKDGDTMRESLKAEWGDFITATRTEGATSPNPPANTGKATMTKEQIRAIADPVARQKAMAENPSLFGLPENN